MANALGTAGGGSGMPTVLAPATWRKARRAQTDADDETWVPDDTANTLNTFDGGDARATERLVAAGFAEGTCGQALDDVAPTLQAGQPSDGSNRQVAVVASGRHTHTTEGRSPTLTASKEGPPAVADEAQAFTHAGYGASVDAEVAPTLQATGQEGNQVQGVVGVDLYNGAETGDVSMTMTGQRAGPHNVPSVVAALVRRLTPVECERLQGFPDAWTDPHGDASDSVRYRELGNAVCVPVAGWVGWRLLAYDGGWRP